MSTWLAHIKATEEDIARVKDGFASQSIEVLDHSNGPLLRSDSFAQCSVASEVKTEAEKLVKTLNSVIRIGHPSFKGLKVLGIVEQDGQRTNCTVFPKPVRIGTRFGSAGYTTTDANGAIVAGEPPVRRFEERLFELVREDERVREAVTNRWSWPPDWAALSFVYETVKTIMSPTHKRSDWRCLVSLGWISESDSRRFWDTAGSHRHAGTQAPASPMPLDEATRLIEGLFRRLVDHLKPR